MMHAKRLPVLLVVFAASILLLSPVGRGFAQTSKERQVWQKTFDVVWTTVNEKYFDPSFGGTDWVAVRKRYSPELESVRTDMEFSGLLTRMLGEIKISHLNILDFATLDKSLARSVITRGLALRDIDNHVAVTRIIEDSPAAKAGLRLGFAVQAIDGVPVDHARNAERQLAGDSEKHRLAILDEADMTREVAIEHWLPPEEKLESVSILNAKRRVLIESKRLGADIGYIHFTNFIAPAKKKIFAAFDSIRNARGIIIDLRGNSGGDTEVGLAVAGLLVEKETQISITRTRKGDNYAYKAKPQNNSYRGPVVILVDEESGSESEEMAAGLQAARRVVVIGKKSRGEDMDATFQQLPMNSIGLLYPVGLPRTSTGVVIEGRGVIPDTEVNLTRAELLMGRDSQLEAAMRYLAGK